jgi:hypothetical protein
MRATCNLKFESQDEMMMMAEKPGGAELVKILDRLAGELDRAIENAEASGFTDLIAKLKEARQRVEVSRAAITGAPKPGARA